jgi:hypothetical protein
MRARPRYATWLNRGSVFLEFSFLKIYVLIKVLNQRNHWLCRIDFQSLLRVVFLYKMRNLCSKVSD